MNKTISNKNKKIDSKIFLLDNLDSLSYFLIDPEEGIIDEESNILIANKDCSEMTLLPALYICNKIKKKQKNNKPVELEDFINDKNEGFELLFSCLQIINNPDTRYLIKDFLYNIKKTDSPITQ